MDKRSFESMFEIEDKQVIWNIYDKMILAERSGRLIFSNEFYPPYIWKVLENDLFDVNFSIKSFGVFEEAERRMLSFSSCDLSSFPISVLRITNKSKYSKLQHKDYLGAIMSLGIKREKFGDIILKENSCYVPVYSDIAEFVLSNLSFVGKNPVDIHLLQDIFADMPSVNMEEMTIISTSLRIDCIISSICNVSRNQAAEMLSSGKVMIDYIQINQRDKIVKFGSILTIRGFGKYKIVKDIGNTQKGRIKLSIKKYI